MKTYLRAQEWTRLYTEGATLQQIAKAFNCDASTVHQQLKAAGVPRRSPGVRPSSDVQQARMEAVTLRTAGYTFAQIGDRLGVSKQRAYQLYQEATK